MSEILIERNAVPAKLEVMGVFNWPVWKKEISTFPWTYDKQETCYLLAGEVTVTPDGGKPVDFSAGDLVIFPAGLACIWEIKQAVEKHYEFS